MSNVANNLRSAYKTAIEKLSVSSEVCWPVPKTVTKKPVFYNAGICGI